MTPEILIFVAWIGIALGIASGAVMGLLFHRETWLGGYGSWPRRMIRLAHISYFGLALLILAYVGSTAWDWAHDSRAQQIGAWALMIGAIAMPVVCYLAAWLKPLRHLFVVPVVAVMIGVACALYQTGMELL